MKYSLLIAVLVSMLVSSCNEANNSGEHKTFDSNNQITEKEDSSQLIIEGYKTITANDTSDFKVRVSAKKGKIRVYLTFSEVLPFQSQIAELKIILSGAAKEFNLDSVTRITMNFYSKSKDLAIDISRVPKIQEHMLYCEENNVGFLDHKLISEEILNSEYLKQVLKSFEKYSIIPECAFVEKCHSKELKSLKNMSIQPVSDTIKILKCAHLRIEMKKIKPHTK